ncbi:glucosamine-6-phosphate deaminase [Maribellus sp. YY47]|uniref:glucosamine-6-phosphate deaminase n=1 Tax=Maribellus sp. YY47 TaxID=2929486 RepID=UPI0020010CD7|nr:glucosamine-6-phosphate deaminase [Maribellus sp. YY47]MCK3684358.1 glucosamine-6-phosphate deaminase [Maribellus sp. YY47]
MSFTKTRTKPITFEKEMLNVNIFPTRDEMGKIAARDVANRINEILSKKEEINIIFAAAPSQNEFLHYLKNDKTVPWHKINAFHMDEYIGLDEDAPQGFANFLKDRLFNKVPFKSTHYINGLASDTDEECKRYGNLLQIYPVDIVCLGIGENGHIAFNDPPVADFNDPKIIKVVELEHACRQQQVNDKCFETISLVPENAFTLTIPTLLHAKYMFCIVPSKLKAEAVNETINGIISEKCPATILRTKKDAILYLEEDSASLLKSLVSD